MAAQQLGYNPLQPPVPNAPPSLRPQHYANPNVNMIPNTNMNPASSQNNGSQQGPTPLPTQPQSKDVSTASLCRLGQEIVQEIVSKTAELFQTLKQLQLPNGTQPSMMAQRDRKEKLQEHLKGISILFKRLRLIYDKCNENCTGMEYTHIESLIPLRDEPDSKLEERKATEVMKYTSEEHREIIEQVVQKNKHFKEIIDHLRSIIWEINTMLAMRRP